MVSPFIPKEKRIQIEEASNTWLQRNKQPEDLYVYFALGKRNFFKENEKKDPEFTSRVALKEVKFNNFISLISDFGNIQKDFEWKLISNDELRENFKLDVNPFAQIPKERQYKSRAISNSSISTFTNSSIDNSNSVLSYSLHSSPLVSTHNSTKNETNKTMDIHSQNELQHALFGALETMINMKFKTNPFRKKGQFPKDNPFNVLLEREGTVLMDSYFDQIKNPCDLVKMKQRLNIGVYTSFEQFDNDMRLIISNSYAYHQEKSALYKMTREFERLYNIVSKKLKAKLGL